MSSRRLYTLLITGGSPISLSVVGNPVLYHPGECRTIYKCIVTMEELNFIISVVEGEGRKVQRFYDRQTAEQCAIRRTLLGLDERLTKTRQCPLCYFYDPLCPEDNCGVSAWSPETLEVSLENEKAKGDLANCPIAQLFLNMRR